MKLEANGVRFETKGNVRVSYPYLGMGVAFVEMSDENRSQLRELQATITRPTVIMGPGIASSLPAGGPLEAVPPISNPSAALQALTEFFKKPPDVNARRLSADPPQEPNHRDQGMKF
jgi:hypothetical protein